MQMRDVALFGAVMAMAFAGLAGGAQARTMEKPKLQAEPVSGKEAAKMLFSPKGAEVEMMPVAGLSAENAALLEQVAKGYAYYAAVAIAPDADIMTSEATMLVANHHSTEAAVVAALEGCNAVREKAKDKGAACVVAAVVRPRKWEPQPLQLSLEATQAFKEAYGKRGERAMATSAKTGFFGMASGANAQAAALEACNAKGAEDCIVVIADAEK